MRIRNNKVLLKLILKKSKQISKALEKKNPRRGRPKLYHTHIVIVDVVRNKAFVVGVNTGIPYTDENFLLMQMLENLKIRAGYFLGDAY